MKKMISRKVLAFVTNMLSILTIYFVTLFRSPEILNTVGPVVIGSLITNAVIFVGGNSYDKWVRAKHFNKELLDK